MATARDFMDALLRVKKKGIDRAVQETLTAWFLWRVQRECEEEENNATKESGE